MLFRGRLMPVSNKRHRDGSMSVRVFSHNERHHVHTVIIGPPQQEHAALIGPRLTVKRERRK